MRPAYRLLRLRQLAKSLVPFERAKRVPRPNRGWLRAVRQALGLTLDQVGQSIGRSRQDIAAFESSEAQDRITLRSLHLVAEAMGCELVYALVPKSGSLADLAEKSARDEATRSILAVEHTMALEAQAAGGVERKIEEETRRILKKR
jgi:predicted DNA-binding mobile mystery protein A